MERESLDVDILIVGAGPAGLAASIKLMKLAKEEGRELSVYVLEKGSEVGAHILSGAVFDPIAINELMPDWIEKGAPFGAPVSQNEHLFLSENGYFSIPHILIPPSLNNKGCYTLSLGNLCRWLAVEAESLGVEIFPGFAAAEILYNEDQSVKGVATKDVGICKNGEKGPRYERGIELHAKYTFFAEGVRGSLTKQVIKRYSLMRDSEPQTYALGIKELWDIDPAQHFEGKVIHTQGWPLKNTVGGGFIYHQKNNQIAIGFVVALDYENPYLSPYEEMQRFKTHPIIKSLLSGGTRVAYGARAINEGGIQSTPKLSFPGGLLIGCSAGFVNVPRIKGSHGAMKSGMLAAEAAFNAILSGSEGKDELTAYDEGVHSSWIFKELNAVRNVRPALSKLGIKLGTIYAGVEMWLNYFSLGFLIPWTLGHKLDHKALKKSKEVEQIQYPKPDGVLTFDKITNVSFSSVSHSDDQPVHLTLSDKEIPLEVNFKDYAGPEQRFCPAGVYEFFEENDSTTFQINPQNCIHCKTCDIKDFNQNINWVVPEGGGGPNYPNM